MGADEAAWQARIDASRDAEDEGRVPEAERELREALREAERPGAARMLVARSLEELADFYHRQGRPTEAEPLYLRSIAAWEEVLGPRQPRVGIPVHNLAVLYLAECRVEEALPLIARVADLWEAALGPSHPDRVTALETEATLLRRCGRGDEASRLDSRMPAGS
jgi:tetratricopeptide (TPR) repeat protein